jgi:hypothetical protein
MLERLTGLATRSKERVMNTAEKSLRYLVDKWLAPAPQAQIRVLRFGYMREDRRRYVLIEASATNGSHAIFFFRHDDGCWCVFPPQTGRPSMNDDRRAA